MHPLTLNVTTPWTATPDLVTRERWGGAQIQRGRGDGGEERAERERGVEGVRWGEREEGEIGKERGGIERERERESHTHTHTDCYQVSPLWLTVTSCVTFAC